MSVRRLNFSKSTPIQSINPYTNEIIAEFEELDQSKILDIVHDAEQSQIMWSRTLFPVRADLFNNLADILEEDKDHYGLFMTREMGKPITQAIKEIEKCAWLCRYYAEEGEKFLQAENFQTDYAESTVHYRPMGVVLGVMPWNFPFWQVFRFAVPTLMAGNSVLLKHASNVSLCSQEIQKIFEKAGFPECLLNSLIVSSEKVPFIIEQRPVKAVSLTGSTEAGRAVAAKAGECLKKSVLELGGSDPYIVFEDADVDEAAKLCAQSRLINSGQSCIGAKRFIIQDSVYEHFKQKFIKELQSYKIGNPQDRETDIGPLARMDLQEKLSQQVEETLTKGARAAMGGKARDKEKPFYPITVLEDVELGMPAYDEELFGPVATLFKFANEKEAIFLANDTSYGLGAAIFTKDYERSMRLAIEKLEVGSCFINDFVKSDPRLPFGGVKSSGYGRELSPFGIREFTNIKTIVSH